MELKVFESAIKLMVGDGIIENLSYVLNQKHCEKVMIVSDEPAYRLGYVDMIKRALSISPIEIKYLYKGVGDIALDKDVEEIASKYRHFNCDGIIAIGKKSAIMAAKGAKILITEDARYVSSFKSNKLTDFPTDTALLVAIPINFGSGFEALPIARIYDKVNNAIYEFDTSYCATDVFVMDTKMTDITPPKAIATYGLFALSLAMECFIKDDTNMMAKAYADAAIGIIYKYLTKCIFKNANKEYRQKIMEAVGLSSCGYAMIKKNNLLSPLSDIISDKYLANYANIYAILFRKYIEDVEVGRAFGYALNSMVDSNDFALYAKESRAQKTLAQIESLYKNVEECVDFNAHLSDFGVKEEDIEEIATMFEKGNEDETLTKEKVIDILKACL